jgi:hypothetical protein
LLSFGVLAECGPEIEHFTRGKNITFLSQGASRLFVRIKLKNIHTVLVVALNIFPLFGNILTFLDFCSMLTDRAWKVDRN